MGWQLSSLARVCAVATLFGAVGCAYGSSDATDGGDESGSDAASTPPRDGAADAVSEGHNPDAGRDSGPAVESGVGEAGDETSTGSDANADDGSSADADEGGSGFDASDAPSTIDASDDVREAGLPDANDASAVDANDSGGSDANDSGVPVDAGDTTAPTVPTGLNKTGSTISSISLAWTASTDNVAVTGYKVFRSGVQVGTSTSTSFTDTGLTVDTAYSYALSAYDAAGNDSAQSAPLTASTAPDTTAPSVPAGLAKTGATSTSVSISWAASTDNVAVTGYKVFRGGVQAGTSVSTSFTDTGRTDATAYSYTVSAYDAAGNTSAQSAALSATTASCSILVTKNTYDTTYDGYVTFQNKGTGAETNPILTFTLPSGATMDMTQCKLNNFVGTGITAVTCTQTGTTVHMNFTGSLAASATYEIYYTTQNATEAVAAGITVTAASCP